MKVMRGLSVIVIAGALVLCNVNVYSSQPSRWDRYAAYQGSNLLKKARATFARTVIRMRVGGGVSTGLTPEQYQIWSQLRQNVEKLRQLLEHSRHKRISSHTQTINYWKNTLKDWEDVLKNYKQDPNTYVNLDDQASRLEELKYDIDRWEITPAKMR